MKLNRTSAALMVAAAAASVAFASPASAATPNVGFLESASGHGPESAPTTVTLKPQMNGANLLVAMVAADGPDSPATQQVTLSDDRHHAWTLQDRHVVFGSIVEVYTAPGTGHDGGTVVTSSLLVHRGDEGQAMTVAAWSHAVWQGTVDKNGSGGIPRLDFTASLHTDTYTVFVDGRHNRPIQLVSGFHTVNIDPVGSNPPGADHDLYEISHLNSHDWPGGVMSTGNTGPIASPVWGIVDANVAPAP